MIKASVTEVDWDVVDQVLAGNKLPEGAITRRMMQDRYKIGKSAALEKINKLVESGTFIKRKCLNNGKWVTYIVLAEGGDKNEPTG